MSNPYVTFAFGICVGLITMRMFSIWWDECRDKKAFRR